jgi:CheY-like chemotaxis protein/predicted regulator of Ras-like GTPase activity (Roadblock/LC7/MglB family)
MPKVLVVDDSLSVRKVVEKALEGRSMEVLSAASGAEAIEHIEREHPDVVVCDVVLPDQDGYQICEYVRGHPVVGRVPVLLISGVVNSTVLSRAAEVQSNDVMFKPFAADELVRKIDALLGARGGSAPASPATSAAVAAAAARTAAAASPRGDGRRVDMETIVPPPDPPKPRRDTSASHGSTARQTPGPVEVLPEADLSADGLKGRLAWLMTTSGAKFVALADREGFLIEFAGEVPLDAEVASALASCLAESSDGIGRELHQGALLGMILEYEKGMLLLQSVGPSALLAVVLGETAALGKARYYIKKVLPELQRAL